jgi:hypothetical protein
LLYLILSPVFYSLQPATKSLVKRGAGYSATNSSIKGSSSSNNLSGAAPANDVSARDSNLSSIFAELNGENFSLRAKVAVSMNDSH